MPLSSSSSVVTVPSASRDRKRSESISYSKPSASLFFVTDSNSRPVRVVVEFNIFLSDFRTGDMVVIDPELLDLIYDVRASLGTAATFEVISAYRSPKTNEMLRGRSNGVAKNSQHVLGNAIDVRLRDVASTDLRDAAIALQRGGVGYYKESDFVHIDTGRVRRW